MKTGYVISDLHLFTNRTCAVERMSEIRRMVRDADLLVLNGDIVDFRWSMLSSINQTIDATCVWLNDLLTYSRSCVIYYIMGNHDANCRFAEALASLQQKNTRFRWSPTHLLWEDKLIFHGDWINHTGTICRRQLPPLQHSLKSPMLHRLYKLAVSLRLHKIAAATRNPSEYVKKIDALLENDMVPSWFSDVHEVYFGHTHTAFSAMRCNGRIYYNTGSMIRHLYFLPMKFSCNALPA